MPSLDSNSLHILTSVSYESKDSTENDPETDRDTQNAPRFDEVEDDDEWPFPPFQFELEEQEEFERRQQQHFNTSTNKSSVGLTAIGDKDTAAKARNEQQGIVESSPKALNTPCSDSPSPAPSNAKNSSLMSGVETLLLEWKKQGASQRITRNLRITGKG
ncbi:hypothetical protein CVT24_003910 [Panaeolus cyanescens]|uniref:Uncharacterized protein n=1 Tax=Panaeolus cyanescens TaxID=181874 RepID=A0A409VVA5_9AGAR|nr:hypothetical protein CVT24_003910 [Panaeolus cyanescens]